MQDIPNKAALLKAVTRFLQADLAEAVSDPALRFRLLVAANLLGVVEREIRLEDVHYEAEVKRLAQLLDGVDERPLLALQDEALRREALAPLYEALFCDKGEDEARFAHVRETLAEKLSIINPRFDLSSTIE